MSLLLGMVVFVSVCRGLESDTSYREIVLTIEQHIETNDLDGARLLISSAGKKYPENGGLENLLGVVEIQQGHADRAKQAFSEAIRHDPKLTNAYLNLGRLYMQASGSDISLRAAALRLYEKVLLSEPDNVEANYQSAVLLMWGQSYQRSLERLRKLDAKARSQVGAEAVACADEASLGHKEAADRAAASMAANAGLTEMDAKFVLPALRAAHRADLLEEIYAAAGERQPLSASGLRLLGLAQEAEGKLEQARSTLERVYAADDSAVAPLVDLARIALASKDYQGAMGYLAHARDLQPKDPSLPYEFGVICLKLNLVGEARKAMGEAVQLAPDNPEYNFGFGTVSSLAQDASSALPYLEKYHELRPSDATGTLALGTTYFRAKDFDRASAWLQKAANNPSTAASAEYYLGRIARQTGLLDEAIKHLSRADALKPDRPEVVAELGGVYVQMRKYAAAEKQLDLAVRLDPDSYAANFALLQLYARTGDSRREAQSRRFESIKSMNEEQYRETMRVIEIRSEGDATANPLK